MTMSHDRIRFKFMDNLKNKEATVRAASKAFGLPESYLRKLFDSYGSNIIVCRPSQFARFLIYRSEKVCNNAFRKFEAKLFIPERESCSIVDVSENPV